MSGIPLEAPTIDCAAPKSLGVPWGQGETAMNKKIVTASILFCGFITGNVQAALYDRGGGLIYDDVLNVTWLQDSNYAKSSGYDSDGRMSWFEATAWTANLSYYDSVRDVTWNDWRLPVVKPVNGVSFNYDYSFNGSTDYGYNISAPLTPYAGSTASEMANLWYSTLGNIGRVNISGNLNPASGGLFRAWDTPNYGPFLNVYPSSYLTDSVYGLDANYTWIFRIEDTAQISNSKYNIDLYAWAVRDGDVAAVAIPEASTYAMFLAGLGLVGFMVRRRKQVEA